MTRAGRAGIAVLIGIAVLVVMVLGIGFGRGGGDGPDSGENGEQPVMVTGPLEVTITEMDYRLGGGAVTLEGIREQLRQLPQGQRHLRLVTRPESRMQAVTRLKETAQEEGATIEEVYMH